MPPEPLQRQRLPQAAWQRAADRQLSRSVNCDLCDAEAPEGIVTLSSLVSNLGRQAPRGGWLFSVSTPFRQYEVKTHRHYTSVMRTTSVSFQHVTGRFRFFIAGHRPIRISSMSISGVRGSHAAFPCRRLRAPWRRGVENTVVDYSGCGPVVAPSAPTGARALTRNLRRKRTDVTHCSRALNTRSVLN